MAVLFTETLGTKLLLLAAAAVLWFLAHGFRLRQRFKLRSIPQAPFGVRRFLVGHILDLAGRLPPYLVYEKWRRQLGGIYLIFLGRSPVVVLTDPELIRQVCVAKFKSFHDRPGFMNIPSKDKRIKAVQSGLLVAKGRYWVGLRASMQPLFHTAALRSYSPIMVQQAGKLAAKLEGAAQSGEPLELHRLLGGLTMGVVGESAFGIEFTPDGAERDQAAGIPNVGAAIMALFDNNRPLTGGGSLGKVLLSLLPSWAGPLLYRVFFVKLGSIGKGLEYARSSFMSTADLLMTNALRRAEQQGQGQRKVTMRRTDWQWWDRSFTERNPYKDVTPAEGSVIDMLMSATNKETGEGLSDMQIAAQCYTLIAAGYDTSSNSLAFSILLLAAHPAAQAKLLAEVDAFGRDKVPTFDDLGRFPYVDAVIQESLRLYPAGWLTMRQANEDVVVGRWLIPKGTRVHINIMGVQRDPAYWREPDSFRPERFLDPEECAARHPNSHMPFGVGPRMCIGWKFALQEIALALIRLYQQYTFQLAPGREDQYPPTIKTGITISPAGGLWVTVHRRE